MDRGRNVATCSEMSYPIRQQHYSHPKKINLAVQQEIDFLKRFSKCPIRSPVGTGQQRRAPLPECFAQYFHPGRYRYHFTDTSQCLCRRQVKGCSRLSRARTRLRTQPLVLPYPAPACLSLRKVCIPARAGLPRRGCRRAEVVNQRHANGSNTAVNAVEYSLSNLIWRRVP